MKEKIVFVADLGRLKAYRLQEDGHFSRPRLELLDDWESGVTRHLREEVSDQAGQYRKGAAPAERPGALSNGEQHNLDLERRRRALRTMAHRISELMAHEKFDGCYLAADARINQQLLEAMPASDRAKFQKTVPANLSKLGPEQVLEHFCA